MHEEHVEGGVGLASAAPVEHEVADGGEGAPDQRDVQVQNSTGRGPATPPRTSIHVFAMTSSPPLHIASAGSPTCQISA